MNHSDFNPIKIELKILYRNFGQEYWSDYENINQKFRKSIGADSGDLKKAKEQLETGILFNILAYCKGEPIGLVRLDMRSQPPVIGDLYVEEKFRHKEAVLENTPWLKNGTDYEVKHYLVKAAFVVARRALFKEVKSYPHNVAGERVADWRRKQQAKWESEIMEIYEPREILDSIKEQKSTN
jgi:hypothetical protein